MELRERAEPLARLAAAGEAAGRGEGRVVLVRGPTGIGKTTLVRAFLDAEDGPAALLGRCDNASVPLVLGPFRDIVDAAGHDLRGMDAASLREAVLEELPGAACVVIEDLHWADEASTDLLAHIAKRIEPRPLPPPWTATVPPSTS
jgi:predicted ATPase